MNARQLQYAIILADVRSFSQAADQLNISQPALSKQIIGLEQELGVKLFDRSTNPLSLTPAGEFFIPKAEQLLFEEDQLLKTIDKFRIGENGKLIIGISPFRSLYMMPSIVKSLQAKFPTIKIVLSEVGTAQLHKGITEGLYDFAIMNLPVDESRLRTIPLTKDKLVLAVPNDMLSLLESKPLSNSDAIDLSICSNLPFVVLSPGQELRQFFDRLCGISGLQPQIHIEVVGITSAWEMVQKGVAATILPEQFIQSSDHPNVTLFELNQLTSTRQPAIVLRRGQYLSPYAEYAIELLSQNF